MEGATITQGPDNEPLYQQGRFPSIIDTDDMVFELGKQVVNHLNHEKIIGNLLAKVQAVGDAVAQAEQKVEPLQKSNDQLAASNKLYEENNKKLDAEIVSLRNQISTMQDEVKEYNEDIEQLQSELAEARKPKQKKKPRR